MSKSFLDSSFFSIWIISISLLFLLSSSFKEEFLISGFSWIGNSFDFMFILISSCWSFNSFISSGILLSNIILFFSIFFVLGTFIIILEFKPWLFLFNSELLLIISESIAPLFSSTNISLLYSTVNALFSFSFSFKFSFFLFILLTLFLSFEFSLFSHWIIIVFFLSCFIIVFFLYKLGLSFKLFFPFSFSEKLILFSLLSCIIILFFFSGWFVFIYISSLISLFVKLCFSVWDETKFLSKRILLFSASLLISKFILFFNNKLFLISFSYFVFKYSSFTSVLLSLLLLIIISSLLDELLYILLLFGISFILFLYLIFPSFNSSNVGRISIFSGKVLIST